MTLLERPAPQPAPPKARPAPKPELGEPRSQGHQALVYAFLLVPMAALLAAVPLAWNFGLLGWVDVVLAVSLYFITGHGVTFAYHRMLTHGSFKANRPLKIAAVAVASMSVQGAPVGWVADHRRHHAHSDKEGDPHSPWLYGTTPFALIKGFWHAHMGWMFQRSNTTNVKRFAPDLLADRDVVMVNRLFPYLTAATSLLPALLGGLITMSWMGAATAFFWAGLVRVSVLHHTTWSTNSVCHMIGERPYASRDKAANFWPLAIVSFGESWHNSHHADPSCARHGVRKGQIDTTARLIWFFEKLGWARDVKWPDAKRLAKLSREEARA